MKKNNTNLTLITSILILIISTSIFVYFLNVIKNKNKHTSAVTATLQEKIYERENIKSLKEKMSELKNTNATIGNYLVDNGRVDTFVEYLENMGGENNVELTVKNISVPKNQKNKILFGVSIRGDFPSVLKALGILENSPYNLNITSSFFNKEIEPTTKVNETTNKEVVLPIKKSSIWQLDVSFVILSI